MLMDLLFIFCARLFDVSFATIRVLMIMRGRRLAASSLGFFEIIIYIMALSRVVNQLSHPINLIVYAFGFSCGTFLGSTLEQRLALGYLFAEIIPRTNGETLAHLLRQHNFGVTVLCGEGKDGPRCVLHVSLPRKNLKQLYQQLELSDPEAFITIFDARQTHGGYFFVEKKK
ncbi:MAG TPA: DUF2179 domain-containing protein [Bacillota bacterium]|jgi:uncharacterized protein YebE (UPF0316 family)|nr:DUF2179 domain-containing protein [Bacillota bacterium]